MCKYSMKATTFAGYYVDGNGTDTITTQGRLSGNYVEIYGNWLPDKWVGEGMHEDPEMPNYGKRGRGKKRKIS